MNKLRETILRRRELPGIDYRDRRRLSLKRTPFLAATAGVAALSFILGIKAAPHQDASAPKAAVPETTFVSAETPPKMEENAAVASAPALAAKAAPGASDAAKKEFAADVDHWIESHAVALQPCYDAYLAEDPAVAEGRVTMNWQIDPDGFVLHPEVVATDLDGLTLADCLVAKLSAFVFPAPPDRKKSLAVHNFDFRKM